MSSESNTTTYLPDWSSLDTTDWPPEDSTSHLSTGEPEEFLDTYAREGNDLPPENYEAFICYMLELKETDPDKIVNLIQESRLNHLDLVCTFTDFLNSYFLKHEINPSTFIDEAFKQLDNNPFDSNVKRNMAKVARISMDKYLSMPKSEANIFKCAIVNYKDDIGYYIDTRGCMLIEEIINLIYKNQQKVTKVSTEILTLRVITSAFLEIACERY